MFETKLLEISFTFVWTAKPPKCAQITVQSIEPQIPYNMTTQQYGLFAHQTPILNVNDRLEYPTN